MTIRRILITRQADTVVAALAARDMSKTIRMPAGRQTALVTAVSELGMNIIKYAKRGSITLSIIKEGQKTGIEVQVKDSGPGIKDIEHAMQDRTSTGGTLGLGLPGTRRLVDEFDIQSTPAEGTRVRIVTWSSR